jgi:hypothetical protein
MSALRNMLINLTNGSVQGNTQLTMHEFHIPHLELLAIGCLFMGESDVAQF